MEKELIIELHRTHRCEKYMAGFIQIPELGFKCDTLEYSDLENDAFHQPLSGGTHEVNTRFIDRNPFAAHLKFATTNKELFIAPMARDAMQGECIMVGKFADRYRIDARTETANDAKVALDVIIRNAAIKKRPIKLFAIYTPVQYVPDVTEDAKPIAQEFGCTDEELEALFEISKKSEQ